MADRPMPFRNPAGHAGLRQNLISLVASLTQFFQTRLQLATRESKAAVGHLGFTGTSLWLDLARRRWVALLTNRVHPTREQSVQAIRDLRRAVADTVIRQLSHH